MRISENLFHDGQLKDRKRLKLLSKLERDERVEGIQLVIRIREDDNLLHIMTARELDRVKNRGSAVVLAGIAKDREGAMMVVQDIVMSALNTHGAVTSETIDKELDIHWTI